MAKENKTDQPTYEDLMKAIHNVLDEALGEYDTLMKNEGIDYAQAIDDKKGAGQGIVGEGTQDGMAKEDEDKPVPSEDDKDKEDDKDDDKEEDEEKLMSTYKSLVAKMEKKGLMAKMKKSETASEPKASESKVEVESLRKSVDERFDVLHKAIVGVQEVVKKIAAQPAAPRKGVAGYQPLRKSETEGAPSLKKSEVIDKLLELKKSGDARVDSTLINRVETGRLIKSDVERMKALGILV